MVVVRGVTSVPVQEWLPARLRALRRFFRSPKGYLTVALTLLAPAGVLRAWSIQRLESGIQASGLTCVVNLGAEPVALPSYEKVLAVSGALTPDGRLPADTAVWLA